MSSKAYPEGGTVVQTLKRSFVNVTVDANKKVNTAEFLEAAESLTALFDAIGAISFSPVKKDMIFNVGRIRDQQNAAPAESTNLQDLVEHELKSNKQNGAGGLLWLIRAIDFTFRGVNRTVENPKEELAEAFRASYKETLKPHHPFWIKPIFTASMSTCPYRADFFAKLGDDIEQVTSELKEYLAALSNIINILSPFIEAKAANKWK